MFAWKYIHPIDENIVLEIYGTTWKFFKKHVYSVMGKAGFYNTSQATFEHGARANKADTTQSQCDDTHTLESNFVSSPDPPCNCKVGEASDENTYYIQ